MRNMTTIALTMIFMASLTTASMAFDKGDGESKGCKCKAGGSGHAKMTEKFDKDGDGKLSEEEKAAAKAAHKEKMAERKAKFMEKFDKDGDGDVSEEEMTAAKAAHKEKVAERKAKFMEKFDKDGDGTLSEEEKAAIKKGGKGGCKGGRRHGKAEESSADSLVR
jgi:hypothetical protein